MMYVRAFRIMYKTSLKKSLKNMHYYNGERMYLGTPFKSPEIFFILFLYDEKIT